MGQNGYSLWATKACMTLVLIGARKKERRHHPWVCGVSPRKSDKGSKTRARKTTPALPHSLIFLFLVVRSSENKQEKHASYQKIGYNGSDRMHMDNDAT